MVITDNHEYLCEEEKRLNEDRERKKYWKRCEIAGRRLIDYTKMSYQVGFIHGRASVGNR